MNTIAFSAEMIRCYQRGQKTQTRRVINPQPKWGPDGWGWNSRGWTILEHDERTFRALLVRACPYGQPRDRLGFLEGYQVTAPGDVEGEVSGYFLADSVSFLNVALSDAEYTRWSMRKYPYRATPGRFMYHSLIRYKPQIVSVRVERVQDISHEDVLAEGGPFGFAASSDEDFSHLWDTINAKRGHPWIRNDWVWVIEFPKFEGF